jgi:hypothetical protein
MQQKLVRDLNDRSPAEQRKLLEMLYKLARRQLATGSDTTGRPVCSADFAITNNARKLIDDLKRQMK